MAKKKATAWVFHDRIMAHLEVHPDRARSKVAKFLGISRQSWSQYLDEIRNPNEKTINLWLARCREAGLDAFPVSVRAALEAQL